MATRFWVGGTGTWDAVTTTNWAASSGGAGGQTVPGSSDTVTFDGASGGGTVTLNFGGLITLQSITMGAFTGTWDNSVNNNNMTLTTASGFVGSGAGTRNIKLGSATYTLSTSNPTWNFTTTTGLTFTGGSATIVFSSTSAGTRSFFGGALTYGTLTLATNPTSGFYTFTASNTFGTLNITAPVCLQLQATSVTTISNTATFTGSSTSPISFITSSVGGTATLGMAASSTFSWCAFRDITCTGAPTATDSFNLGDNSGITINAPGGVGTSITGGIGVIGS